MLKLNNFLKTLVIYLLGFILAIGMGYFVSTNAFSIFKVSGDSMDFTLRDGQTLYVNRLPFQRYKKGDIVVAKVDGLQIVKRVVAVGGDTIQMIEGKLVVNGNVVKEDYVSDEGYPIGNLKDKQTIEDGDVYVLGDNRDVSRDSRYFGAISERQILGSVINK